MKKRTKIILGVVAGTIVLVGILYTALRNRSTAQEAFQTEALQRGDISVSVGGTGNVQSNQSAVVPWQTGGKIETILVARGDRVEAGDILAELAMTSVSQNILQAQVDLINAQQALDDAINNTESRVQAQLDLLQAEQDLQDAEKESRSMLYQRATDETIDIAKANLINAQAALDQAQQNFDRVAKWDEDSPVYASALSAYASARQQAESAEYNLNYVQGLPDPLTVEEAYLNVELAQARLLSAKQEWERVRNGPDQDEVLAAQTRVDIAQGTLDLAHLEAPFSGTVTAVDCQVGDLVSAGSPRIQVDDLSRLLLDIDISEVDINQVKIGQRVSLTFDAIPNQEYEGTVSDISWLGSSASGSVNFSVTVEIQDPTEAIKPGMTAAAYITVTELTDVLLVPNRAVRTVEGDRVVYILRNNQPLPVQIVLGASASAYSQVVEGDLEEGDLIILNPPSTLFEFGMGGGMR